MITLWDIVADMTARLRQSTAAADKTPICLYATSRQFCSVCAMHWVSGYRQAAIPRPGRAAHWRAREQRASGSQPAQCGTQRLRNPLTGEAMPFLPAKLVEDARRRPPHIGAIREDGALGPRRLRRTGPARNPNRLCDDLPVSERPNALDHPRSSIGWRQAFSRHRGGQHHARARPANLPVHFA